MQLKVGKLLIIFSLSCMLILGCGSNSQSEKIASNKEKIARLEESNEETLSEEESIWDEVDTLEDIVTTVSDSTSSDSLESIESSETVADSVVEYLVTTELSNDNISDVLRSIIMLGNNSDTSVLSGLPLTESLFNELVSSKDLLSGVGSISSYSVDKSGYSEDGTYFEQLYLSDSLKSYTYIIYVTIDDNNLISKISYDMLDMN